jgi:chemotaxis protein methyltransferase CheR
VTTDPPRPAADGALPALSAGDLERICEYLYRRTGMQYGEAKRYFVDRRVADRMVEVGIASFATYFMYLRSAPAETELLINSFTVNETYFYREDHQLRALSRGMLPEVLAGKRPGDLVRIWSVACSTGEEPYSIAIWLLENWPLVDAYNIEIVGSDIDTRALAEARIGDYDERSLSRLPQAVVDAYFTPQPDGTMRIIQDLRESVRFTAVNLVDQAVMALQGRFDVIFCRNVLIYFGRTSRLLASEHLYDSLVPGGFICLGHAESMTRISSRFLTRRFPDAIVHQRPAG